MIRIIAAALAAVLLTCAPAAAQLDTRTIPQAQPLTGTERMPAVQGSGCPAKTTPCASVAITPSLISTFLAPTFQPLDTDLSAIAALVTTSTGRDLLTSADAAAIRTKAGLGLVATQDYQEGTFTPSLLIAGSATGITYSTQVGRYTKVGRVVVAQIVLILSSKGTGSGAATIGGLPYNTAVIGSTALILNRVSAVATPSATAPANGTSINLVTYNGSDLALVQASNLKDASEIYLTLTYTI